MFGISGIGSGGVYYKIFVAQCPSLLHFEIFFFLLFWVGCVVWWW